MVVSTGMTNYENVCKMYEEVTQANVSLAMMQCTSCYPTNVNEINLNVMKVIN